MISSIVTRTSAAVLFAGGAALLFAADSILPMLVPGYPRQAAWLGQLLGGAWLGVAAMNWLQRRVLLGGIYGRPVVFANLMLYFVSALVLLEARPVPWVPAALFAGLAAVYGALLLRGPFDPPAAGVPAPAER